MERPGNLPTCKHGKIAGTNCRECYEEDTYIRTVTKPLVDEFWEYQGQRDLKHLMLRAYKMGMKHDD